MTRTSPRRSFGSRCRRSCVTNRSALAVANIVCRTTQPVRRMASSRVRVRPQFIGTRSPCTASGAIGCVGPNRQYSSRSVVETAPRSTADHGCRARARGGAHRAGAARIAAIQTQGNACSRRLQNVSMTGEESRGRETTRANWARTPSHDSSSGCDHNPHAVSDLLKLNESGSCPVHPANPFASLRSCRGGRASGASRRARARRTGARVPGVRA